MQQRILDVMVGVVGVAMVIYHLTYSQLFLQGVMEHLIFHLGLALLLVFLMELRNRCRPLESMLVLLSLGCYIYLRLSYERLELYGMYQATNLDLAVGIILILLCFEATRRKFGPVLPALALLCIVYAFIGSHLPGILKTLPMSWDVIIERLSVGFAQAGIFGPILSRGS